MAKIGRPGLPTQERRRVWELWKTGKSFSEISRQVGVPPGSVYSILLPRGGFYFPEPKTPSAALSHAEREEISRGIAAERSARSIAADLGRAPSTVTREIARNKGRAKYRAVDANDRAQRNRARPQRLKLQKNPVLANYVGARLNLDWSPEEIAGRLDRDYPDNPRMHISAESIYHAVFLNVTRNVFASGIHHHLRRGRPLRHGKHYTTRGQWRSQIKDAKPISDRPEEAEDRCVPGHVEGDLILGKNTSQVATLVDRCTRVVNLVATPARQAAGVRNQLIGWLNSEDTPQIKTLTWDRGMELAEHQAITEATDVEIYFADPRSPWQRGTNENTNGLLRQYLPKKTDLSTTSQAGLDIIADRLNNRPRKCLNYRTPLEAAKGVLP